MTFTPPLSRRISIANLPASGEIVQLEASKDERRAIALAYDLPEVRRFVANLRITPKGKGGAHLRGDITADVDRTCVVSLDPFPVKLREPLDLSFAPAPPARAKEEEIDALDVDFESDDPPETIENGMIDAGAVVCEFFALSLDPYPRRPGVAFDSPEKDAVKANPFAVLAKLKDAPE